MLLPQPFGTALASEDTEALVPADTMFIHFSHVQKVIQRHVLQPSPIVVIEADQKMNNQTVHEICFAPLGKNVNILGPRKYDNTI